MIKYFLVLFIFTLLFLGYKKKELIFKNNNKIKKFKNSFTSTESKIEKIFIRNNERLIQDPNINLKISFYEKEPELKQKTNIHRSRLAKFNKSKLNGEYIYSDTEGNIYKIIKNKKIYID